MKKTALLCALCLMVAVIPVHAVSSTGEISTHTIQLTTEQNQKLGDIQNRLNELVKSLNSNNHKLKRLKKLISSLNKRIANFKVNPTEPVDEIIASMTKKVEKLESSVNALSS